MKPSRAGRAGHKDLHGLDGANGRTAAVPRWPRSRGDRRTGWDGHPGQRGHAGRQERALLVSDVRVEEHDLLAVSTWSDVENHPGAWRLAAVEHDQVSGMRTPPQLPVMVSVSRDLRVGVRQGAVNAQPSVGIKLRSFRCL